MALMQHYDFRWMLFLTFIVWTDVACGGATASDVCGASSGHTEVAMVNVTRSTNSPAIDVTVFCDGSADRTLGTPGDDNSLDVMPKTYAAGSPEVTACLSDLDAVADVSAIPTGQCAKSGSFGTETTITARGKTSGDLQCLVDASAAETALATDCAGLAGP